MEASDEKLLDFSDFQKMELRAATIKSAEPVEGADKLLKMEIDLGSETRQIVAGIAQHYQVEDLPGKTIVVVANLKPATIRGVESRGMLLAAEGGDTLSLVILDRELPPGSPIR